MSTNESASKIYTRTGDKGKTSLIGGSRVSKSHLRLDTYGTVDELNSIIGALRADIKAEIPSKSEDLGATLNRIQNDLFNVGSQLACEDPKMREQLPHLTSGAIETLEGKMDEYSLQLIPLKNFVLPGGTRASSMAHVARTVCRRAERLCVRLAESGDEIDPALIQYLNRLSDFFFVMARYLNHLQGVAEPIWAPKTETR